MTKTLRVTILTLATCRAPAALAVPQPSMADYVGSLVVPHAGDRTRPTNWEGIGPRPPGVTIQDFPGLMQRRRDGLRLHPPAWDRGID